MDQKLSDFATFGPNNCMDLFIQQRFVVEFGATGSYRYEHIQKALGKRTKNFGRLQAEGRRVDNKIEWLQRLL